MMNDSPVQRDASGSVWKETIIAVWWISVLWLCLTSLVMAFFLAEWAFSSDDPLRYETAIISAFVFFGSLPAGLGVLISGLVPKTRLSLPKRIGGIALLVFCIGILLAHDYLQARFR